MKDLILITSSLLKVEVGTETWLVPRTKFEFSSFWLLDFNKFTEIFLLLSDACSRPWTRKEYFCKGIKPNISSFVFEVKTPQEERVSPSSLVEEADGLVVKDQSRQPKE